MGDSVNDLLQWTAKRSGSFQLFDASMDECLSKFVQEDTSGLSSAKLTKLSLDPSFQLSVAAAVVHCLSANPPTLSLLRGPSDVKAVVVSNELTSNSAIGFVLKLGDGSLIVLRQPRSCDSKDILFFANEVLFHFFVGNATRIQGFVNLPFAYSLQTTCNTQLENATAHGKFGRSIDPLLPVVVTEFFDDLVPILDFIKTTRDHKRHQAVLLQLVCFLVTMDREFSFSHNNLSNQTVLVQSLSGQEVRVKIGPNLWLKTQDVVRVTDFRMSEFDIDSQTVSAIRLMGNLCIEKTAAWRKSDRAFVWNVVEQVHGLDQVKKQKRCKSAISEWNLVMSRLNQDLRENLSNQDENNEQQLNSEISNVDGVDFSVLFDMQSARPNLRQSLVANLRAVERWTDVVESKLLDEWDRLHRLTFIGQFLKLLDVGSTLGAGPKHHHATLLKRISTLVQTSRFAVGDRL